MRIAKFDFEFDDEADECTKLDNNKEEEDETLEAEVVEEEEAEVTVKNDGAEFSHFDNEEEFINNKNDYEEFVNTPRNLKSQLQLLNSKSQTSLPISKPTGTTTTLKSS